MEISEVFKIAEKQLIQTNEELDFKKVNEDEKSITFAGEKGAYRIMYDSSASTMAFECCYDYKASEPQFDTISRSLFDAETYNEKDAKSLGNEINDEIKKNIVKYGEFLPETFFTEIGTPKVIDVIKNGNSADQKRLFKMLNEVYEDGTNEVQDVIGVTILGAMQNDKDMMAVADKYMSDYMSGPVHEINKLTAKKGSSLMKKLKNPPAYKPKKKKNNFMQNALQAQDINR